MFFCFRWWRGPETTRSYIKRANKTSGGNLGGQKWLFHRNFLVLLAHGCLLSVPIRVTKMSSAAFFFLSSSQLQTDDKAVSRLKSTLAHFLKRWKNVNVVSSFFKISFWKQSKTELPPLVKKLEITTRKILVIYESGIDFPMANSTFFKNLYYFFIFTGSLGIPLTYLNSRRTSLPIDLSEVNSSSVTENYHGPTAQSGHEDLWASILPSTVLKQY